MSNREAVIRAAAAVTRLRERVDRAKEMLAREKARLKQADAMFEALTGYKPLPEVREPTEFVWRGKVRR